MKRFAFVAIILATCVTSFAAKNIPPEERASWPDPADEGDGYCAGSDPIWINFFGGGFGGGTFGSDSGGDWGSPGPTRMACVRCTAEGTCEGVAGGRAFAFCKFDPNTGKCTETGTCWSE